jgi:hypothetical protein
MRDEARRPSIATVARPASIGLLEPVVHPNGRRRDMERRTGWTIQDVKRHLDGVHDHIHIEINRANDRMSTLRALLEEHEAALSDMSKAELAINAMKSAIEDIEDRAVAAEHVLTRIKRRALQRKTQVDLTSDVLEHLQQVTQPDEEGQAA